MTSAILAGLVGRHIGASRSPWLHEREARAQGFELTYTLFDFATTRHAEHDLCAQIATVERLGYAGLNVTHPYKQAVIGCLDDLTPNAAVIGAVNTVQFAAGRRVGHNTDALGFAASFRDRLPSARLGRVLQLGAGGAGAAVAHALLDLGAKKLVICDREPARANDLVSKLNAAFGAGRAETAPSPESALASADGLVNATPMGMADDPRAPIDASLLMPRQWVADIVYFPLETELLRAARARGCPTLDGSGMAVRQAAAAFEIFTGRRANVPRMLRSFEEFEVAQPGDGTGA